jgi:serine/threonine-protein kinase
MGSLYLARDPGLDRLVAIKIPKDEYLDDPEFRQRFAREARALAKLHHPNIVVVHDIGEHEGRPFMAMEYVNGETLREQLARPPLLALTRGLELVESLCAALARAHAAGIIHRDVKPENMMLDQDGVLKLLDFGIARQAHSDSMTQMTRPGMLVGTRGYMPPEQLMGGPVDHRSDIFAAGAVLYQVIAREPALFGTFSAVYESILSTGSAPVEAHLRGIDADLARIVTRALARDPERRYQSANDMRQDLAECRLRLSARDAELAPANETVLKVRATNQASQPSSAPTVLRPETPPPDALQPAAGTESRGRRRTLIGVVSVAALAIVVVAFVLRETNRDPVVERTATTETPVPAPPSEPPTRVEAPAPEPPPRAEAPPAAASEPPRPATSSVGQPPGSSPATGGATSTTTPITAAPPATTPSAPSATTPSAPAATPSPKLVQFIDPGGRFSIEVPDNWRWRVVAGSGEPMAVFTPVNYQAAIVVERFRLRSALSPSDVTPVFAEFEADGIKQNHPMASNVVAKFATRGGLRGAVVEYNRPGVNELDRVRTYSFPIGTTLYRITSFAPASRFESYDANFDAVAWTLKPADVGLVIPATQQITAAGRPPRRPAQVSAGRPGFEQFTDADRRFSIEHPYGWDSLVVAGFGEPVSVFLPDGRPLSVIVERVRLKVRLGRQDVGPVLADTEAEILKENQRAVSNVSSRVVRLDGTDVIAVDYSRSGTSGPERVRMYTLVFGDILFRTSCIAPPNEFPAFEFYCDALVRTLRPGNR